MFTRESYAKEWGERRDCSIRAFSVAACISYKEALEIFTKFGRKHNQGTPERVTEQVIDEQFPDAEKLPGYGLTLPKFAQRFNSGHYVVHVRGHALAITDGIIHDWRLRPKTKVYRAWKLV